MKKIALFLVFSCSWFVVRAQLDNTVEVTNEVKPVVTDVKKVDVKTKAAETKVTHYTMQYAVAGQALNNYAPEPLGDYESEAVWKGRKKGYVHLSGGSHGNLDGKIGYQFDLTENDAFNIDLSLKGFNGTVKDNDYYGVKDWKSRDYRNRAALKYNHRFDNGVDFFAKGAFENHLFNYSGGYGVTDKQHNVLGDFEVGITPYQVGDFSIGAKAGVDFFGQNYCTSLVKKLGETFFHGDADAAYRITDEHRIGLGLSFVGSSYRNDELKGIGRFRFTPHYLYNTEQMAVKLGVFVSTKGNIAPDVAFTYHLTPQSDVYVEARGYEEDNNLRHLSAIHPYFALNGYIGTYGSNIIDMEAEFHQMDARLGYRFKGKNGFSGNISGGFDLSKNHANMTWISNSLNGIDFPWMEFSKSKCFYVSADFIYAYKDIVKVDARNRVNIESNKDGVMDWLEGSYITPAFNMNWKADFKLIKGLYVGLDWQLLCFSNPAIDVIPGPAYERPNIVNLGASVRYTLPVDLPLTVFVKGDNLFNQNYDRYFGYRNIGTNFLAGFAMSF
ncbi:MAG: hypothetical protein IJ693_01295 [Bacteroidaceae bacterium]|nr:hypothetical protein [Bacteroidaceae bacterium]